MEFKKYLTKIEAFQWFPGMEAPWTIEKMEANEFHRKDVYYVLHLGDKYDYGTYGPLIINPGDYIVKDPKTSKYSWVDKATFEKIYVVKDKEKKKLEKLQAKERWLRCLEHAGVDNWEGFSYAIELWEERYGEEELP